MISAPFVEKMFGLDDRLGRVGFSLFLVAIDVRIFSRFGARYCG
jgi:hypothetical protein